MAAGNVADGGTENPPCNRKGRAGNPPPKGARASALPDKDPKASPSALLEVVQASPNVLSNTVRAPLPQGFQPTVVPNSSFRAVCIGQEGFGFGY